MPKKSIQAFIPSKTIDEVIGNLDLIINEAISQKNYLGVFAYVYQRTTVEIKEGLLDGRFENPKLMEVFDVTFANLYIEAYRNNELYIETPESWAIAFDVKMDRLAIIQHILLGMNAHINLDLAVAAAKVASGLEIINLKNDFMKVNQILSELTNTIQKGLGKASFVMKIVDIFLFKKDEKIINFSIKKSRDFAWVNALELALLDNIDRPSRIKEIDKKVADIGKLIKSPPGLILKGIMMFISIFEKRDIGKLIEKLKKE